MDEYSKINSDPKNPVMPCTSSALAPLSQVTGYSHEPVFTDLNDKMVEEKYDDIHHEIKDGVKMGFEEGILTGIVEDIAEGYANVGVRQMASRRQITTPSTAYRGRSTPSSRPISTTPSGSSHSNIRDRSNRHHNNTHYYRNYRGSSYYPYYDYYYNPYYNPYYWWYDDINYYNPLVTTSLVTTPIVTAPIIINNGDETDIVEESNKEKLDESFGNSSPNNVGNDWLKYTLIIAGISIILVVLLDKKK